jgi:hypothetical protein
MIGAAHDLQRFHLREKYRCRPSIAFVTHHDSWERVQSSNKVYAEFFGLIHICGAFSWLLPMSGWKAENSSVFSRSDTDGRREGAGKSPGERWFGFKASRLARTEQSVVPLEMVFQV